MNNQRQLGLAMQGFEAAKKRFPGHVNRHYRSGWDGSTSPARERYFTTSWLVELFGYLERSDLEFLWGPQGGGSNPVVGLGFTKCPSDARPNAPGMPVLAYVVNSGLPMTVTSPYVSGLTTGPFLSDAVAMSAGVFHNLHTDPLRCVSLDYVSTHDGSGTTLMLSENAQATEYCLATNTLLTPWQAETTMVWWRNFNDGAAYTVLPTNTLAQNAIGINAHRDDPITIPAGDIAPDYAYPPQSNLNGWISQTALKSAGASDATDFLGYARPSSRHPGGVLMTYCDSHTVFVSETIDYDVYRHIMTPNGKMGIGLDSNNNVIPLVYGVLDTSAGAN
jgi:hypothetical protein